MLINLKLPILAMFKKIDWDDEIVVTHYSLCLVLIVMLIMLILIIIRGV
jgi:hypothetical protein